MRHVARLLPAALLAVLGAPASAQDTVPEVRAELVQLDVVVTDAQGHIVRDLGRDDFQVLEDGKPQRLAQFFLTGRSRPAHGEPASTAEPAGTPPAAASPAEDRVDGPGRRVVVVVDDLHIAPANLVNTKRALKRLVDEFVAPDDDVAVVTSSAGLVQQMTRDRAVIKQSIDRLTLREAVVAPARGSQMTPAEAEMILRGDATALLHAARNMVEEPGSKFDGSTPQGALGGGAPLGLPSDASAAEKAAAREAERQARGVLAEALRFSTATLGIMDGVLRGLAPMTGRKLCLLVSDGFLVGVGTPEERTRDVQRLIDAATRSGTVVYALDTRGLVTTGGDASALAVGMSPGTGGLTARVQRHGDQLMRQTLESLANDTGGFLVRGTNDLAIGLRRMLDDNETYYLMAYEPANTRRDGRFRKIEVRLPRHPGFTVRTRKGYLAPDDGKRSARGEPPAARGSTVAVPVAAAAAPAAPAAVAAPRALDESEARSVLAASVSAGGIPVRLTADYVDLPPAGPQAVVRAHVDVSGLGWQESGGRHRASLELVGGLYDANGIPVGAPFGRRADLDLPAGEFKRVTADGLQYQERMPVRPGRYQVKLVARDPAHASSGAAAEWVEVPDLADKKLAMSGVFLSTSASTAAVPGGQEAVRDAHTLRRFRRGDSLYFQLYVYNPLLDQKGASDVVLQAQIWGGGQAIAASRAMAVAFQEKDGLPLPETNGLPLEGLAPGGYELRVVVVDRKAGAQVFRRVDFTVE